MRLKVPSICVNIAVKRLYWSRTEQDIWLESRIHTRTLIHTYTHTHTHTHTHTRTHSEAHSQGVCQSVIDRRTVKTWSPVSCACACVCVRVRQGLVSPLSQLLLLLMLHGCIASDKILLVSVCVWACVFVCVCVCVCVCVIVKFSS